MKIKEFRNLLKKESDDIEIVKSKKLLETPISTVEKQAEVSVPSKRFTYRLATVLSCCLALIVSVLAIFFTQITPAEAQNITSYVIEINPSVCITTDAEDKIISVVSLNDDADEILASTELENVVGLNVEDFVDKLVKAVSDAGYFVNYENVIKIYAMNDDEEIKNAKLDKFEEAFKRNLTALGVGEIVLEKVEMKMEDFKEKLGFEEDFINLDDMKDFLKDKDKYFNPSFWQGNGGDHGGHGR